MKDVGRILKYHGRGILFLNIIICGIGILFLIIQSSNYTWAQCPNKSDFTITLNNTPIPQLEFKTNSHDVLSLNVELLEITKGIVDIQENEIIVIIERDKKIFRNLSPGEYFIRVSVLDCKLYFDTDNKGTGFIINE